MAIMFRKRLGDYFFPPPRKRTRSNMRVEDQVISWVDYLVKLLVVVVVFCILSTLVYYLQHSHWSLVSW